MRNTRSNADLAPIGKVLLMLSILSISACGSVKVGNGAPGTLSLGGMVSGLSGSGLTLANNGGDQLSVQSDGSFTFDTLLSAGSVYDVTVLTQPTNPTQVCRVSGGSGTVTTMNVTSVAVTCSDTVLSLFVGNPGGPGSMDGKGALASFYNPQAVSIDGAGNLYVADTGNATIRKITPAGEVTTVAGSVGETGSADGTGAAARFSAPSGLVADNAGNLYVADTGNKIIRMITPAGAVSTLAGTAGVSGSADGTGAKASFSFPVGMAADIAGNVYVADDNNTIRKIAPGGVVTTLAGTAGVAGSADGTGVAAEFYSPQGIATDGAANLYVADTSNDTIRRITPSGVVTTLAGTAGATGSADGTGAAARFNLPFGVTTDSANTVYVADTGNNSIRMLTPAGVLTTMAGNAGVVGGKDGAGAAASFNNPQGIAADPAGNLYVADTGNDTIREVTSAGVVTTVAGVAPAATAGSADAIGTLASFDNPTAIATDSAGNVYLADTRNCTIRKITPQGVVTTLAGTAGFIGSADATGAQASFKFPMGVAVDRAGDVYVADTGNDTIRKITPTGTVTTLAGSALVIGSADGTGPLASFYEPMGIATDGANNVYVADYLNNAIRKITPAGVVTTLAGSAATAGSADGTGASARFNYPQGVATDAAANVYVADTENDLIRKITPAGTVTTTAGVAGAIGSADGTGASARFYRPTSLVMDAAGNLYVADTSNNLIRKITPAGDVVTIVGQAASKEYLFGPLPGSLLAPRSVALFDDTLYVTTGNAVVRVSNVP